MKLTLKPAPIKARKTPRKLYLMLFLDGDALADLDLMNNRGTRDELGVWLAHPPTAADIERASNEGDTYLGHVEVEL